MKNTLDSLFPANERLSETWVDLVDAVLRRDAEFRGRSFSEVLEAITNRCNSDVAAVDAQFAEALLNPLDREDPLSRRIHDQRDMINHQIKKAEAKIPA